MKVKFSPSSIGVLVIIAAAAIILSFGSFLYTSYTTAEISKIASDDVRSNVDIQAGDLANILENRMEGVTTNLQIISEANNIQRQDVEGAKQLFTSARQSTSGFASSYFWIDRNGTLLWADAFTNKTIEEQYNGDDRSYRDYYLQPKDTLKPYFSTVIESVDGIPRLYISYPIIGNPAVSATASPSLSESSEEAAVSEGEFRGVVVAAIDVDAMGQFLQDSLSPKYASTTGLLDRNGIILYSTSPENIGKNVFGPEFQALLPAELKDSFNNFIRESLRGTSGSGEFSYQGKTSTLAYHPVEARGNYLGVLFVVAPHELANNVQSLIQTQTTFNIITSGAIGAVAVGVAFLVILSNKRLTKLVDLRTSELKSANESLIESNRQLANVNQQLASANEQLLQANEQLKANDKMQREFINIAAHELRTPTQAIIGYSDLFEMQPEGREGAMQAVARNAMRLERLTQDILDVSRIEGKALQLEKDKFHIKEVIHMALEDAYRQILNGDIKIVYNEPKDIVVEADKARIVQVISNLLNNAIKFTKKGTIFVGAEKDANASELIVSISDTGSGIHPDIQPRLFTKFASKSQTGTGLGLFISKSIVESHGGRITAKNNEDGKGATFSFTLPL